MTSIEADKYYKAFDQQRHKYESKYEKRSLSAIAVQIRQGIDLLKTSNSPADAVTLMDGISVEPVKELYLALYDEVGLEFARRTLRKVKADTIQILRKDDDDILTSLWAEIVNEKINGQLSAQLIKVTETTVKFLKDQIAIAVNEGLSIDDTAKLIQAKWGDVSTARATRIARTEVISASNWGSLEGAKQTGLTLNKVWISTRDSRTRRPKKGSKFDHVSSDNEESPINNGLFTVSGEKLEYPGDRSNGASAGNVVNCRCAIGYNRMDDA